MRWKKTNHRHALRGYDYFVQGPRNNRWPWFNDGAAAVIFHLREHYGREMLDTERLDRWATRSKRKIPYGSWTSLENAFGSELML